MATLQNVHGASLVPDISGSLNLLTQSFQKQQDIKRQQEAAAAKQKQIEQIMNGQTGMSSGSPAQGSSPQMGQEQLMRIAQIDPKLAETLQGIMERGDEIEIQQVKAETERGVREAALLQQAKTPKERINTLNSLAAAAQAEGRPIDRYVEIANMSPAQQDLELQRMQVMGTDIKSLTTPKEEKLTALEQQLQAAGLQPGTPEYQSAILNKVNGVLSPEALAQKQRIASAGSTRIENNVNSGGQQVEREELAKIDAKEYGRVLEKAEASQETLDNLNQLQSIDVETGALEPAKVALASIVEGFGVDASSIANVRNAEAFNSVSDRLVNNVLNKAKGPQTEQDAARARNTIASLKDTPGGKEFKINAMKALALRDIEMADFIKNEMDRQAERGEIKSYSNARSEWNKFKRETPLLSNSVKNPSTGLPVFFYEFRDNARRKRPNVTDEEIINAWRQVNG